MRTSSDHRRRTLLRSGLVLACLTVAALGAASASAQSTLGARAASLQEDVDALVAAGAPGGSCSCATETVRSATRRGSPT